ncbi:MAG: FAD-binding oxidoreductase [Gluconobacter cerinus]|uniref:NAD(P)/FAD-dependent oxidoreductase n=1 Tax=Gluconobacter cerinus TaxID=38307 RepID=UPI0039ED965C
MIVLGGGMVGTATALHLQQRGFDVVLVDQNGQCRETSYGNAGLIQREATRPYAFPGQPSTLLNIAVGRDNSARFTLSALGELIRPLSLYARFSMPDRYRIIMAAYERIIRHSLSEHAPLIEQSGSDDLLSHSGWRHIFSGRRKDFLTEADEARRIAEADGLTVDIESSETLCAAEPCFRVKPTGAIFWRNPWAVSEPGTLVDRYAALFERRGGRRIIGDARTLVQSGPAWTVETIEGTLSAEVAVVALGPWSHDILRPLGYKIPLFVKRGYHQSYRCEAVPSVPFRHEEAGVMVLPGVSAVRITTGAEFAARGAAPDLSQLEAAKRMIGPLLGLGEALPSSLWQGSRPCMPDMLPVIGAAPRHHGLWFNFGHGHQGFTLGPASGRLLAEMMSAETPFIDPSPYLPNRWMRG